MLNIHWFLVYICDWPRKYSTMRNHDGSATFFVIGWQWFGYCDKLQTIYFSKLSKFLKSKNFRLRYFGLKFSKLKKIENFRKFQKISKNLKFFDFFYNGFSMKNQDFRIFWNFRIFKIFSKIPKIFDFFQLRKFQTKISQPIFFSFQKFRKFWKVDGLKFVTVPEPLPSDCKKRGGSVVIPHCRVFFEYFRGYSQIYTSF